MGSCVAHVSVAFGGPAASTKLVVNIWRGRAGGIWGQTGGGQGAIQDRGEDPSSSDLHQDCIPSF